MLTDVAQRWRGGRASYRPAGEPIDTRRYEVATIDGKGADTIAGAFVTEHHYSRALPAVLERVGLYRGGALVGVVIFSEPVQGKVLDCLPCPREVSCELGRLVLLPDVPANGESWLIARAFELVRARGYEGVVSFADPIERTTITGERVKLGHVGTIYQASNARYRGLATARTLRLLPDGTVFSDRTRSKIRKRERGWQHAVDQLVAAGAQTPENTGTAAELAAWMAAVLPTVTRKLPHPGNFKYLFGLTPGVRRRLPPSLPYPKMNMGQQALVTAA